MRQGNVLVIKSQDVDIFAKLEELAQVVVVTHIDGPNLGSGIRRFRKNAKLDSDVNRGRDHHSGKLTSTHHTYSSHPSSLFAKMLNIRRSYLSLLTIGKAHN